MGDAIMEKKMNLLTTKVALSALGIVAVLTGPAFAQQLPQYEVAGFPISPLQISVLGSGRIQEQSFSPTLTLDGMPASPHQIAVIGPRSKQQIADKLKKDASGTERALGAHRGTKRASTPAIAATSRHRLGDPFDNRGGRHLVRGLASVPQIVRTGCWRGFNGGAV